jgi:hypothetical protein
MKMKKTQDDGGFVATVSKIFYTINDHGRLKDVVLQRVNKYNNANILIMSECKLL